MSKFKIIILTFMSLFLVGTAIAMAEDLPAPTQKFTYTIKKFGLKGGEATLTFYDKQKLGEKDVLLIIFKATATGVYDEEKIYVDPQTFRPVRVERDLDLPMSGKEKITEVYDSAGGKIVITKNAKGKTSEQVIKKSGEVDNIYGVIFRYRQQGNFNLGDTVQLNLPTTDLKLKLKRQEALKAVNKTYQAFYMESTPAKYRIWFDASNDRLPLRIDGAVGFGSTSMILKEYRLN